MNNFMYFWDASFKSVSFLESEKIDENMKNNMVGLSHTLSMLFTIFQSDSKFRHGYI